MKKHPLLLSLLALFFVVPSGLSAEELRWSFKVFLDKKEIGEHQFTVVGEAASRTVVTEARFDVKILFISAFKYRHTATERWSEGRLESISSETNNDGDRLSVEGKLTNEGFRVESTSGTRILPDSVQSFAYWTPRILQADRLLNAQTGEYETVSVTEGGTSTITYDGDQLEAKRYDIAAGKKVISVWYGTADRRWLALETPVEGGRTLRYQPVELPESAPVAARFGN